MHREHLPQNCAKRKPPFNRAWVGIVTLSVLASALLLLSLPGNSSKAATGPSEDVNNGLVASLKDGGTVELLGVAHQGGKRTWWSPDGSPIERPFDDTEFNMSMAADDPQASWPTVAVRFKSIDTTNAFISFDHAAQHAGTSKGSYQHSRFSFYAGDFPEGTDETNVRIGFGVGTPGPWREIQKNGVSVPTTDNEEIPEHLMAWYALRQPRKLHPLEDKTLALLGEFDARHHSGGRLSVEVFDDNGNTIADGKPVRHLGEPALQFDVDYAHATGFRFRITPFRQCVTFEDVSLRRGHTTQPRSVVSDVAATPLERGLVPQLRVLQDDGREAVFNQIVPAAAGFSAARKLSRWIGWKNRYGVAPLKDLPQGSHLLMVGPSFAHRTAFHVKIPSEEHVLQRRVRKMAEWPQATRSGKTTRDAWSHKVSVETNSAGEEEIVMTVTNFRDKPIVVRPEDVSLIVFRYDMMATAPQIIDGNNEGGAAGIGDEETDYWLIPPQGKNEIRINWPRCVRRCIWSWGDTNGPYFEPQDPKKVGVRPCIRNSGALPIALTDPQIIVDRNVKESAGERPL